jgi:hypothetical protein
VNGSLRQWITGQEFDIFGISETNLYWPNVKPEIHLEERISGWWNPTTTRLTYAYNYQDKNMGHRRTRQYGGVAQITTGPVSLKYQAQGRDPSGLGRWTWQWFKGKGRHSLRVITAYRPCRKDESAPFSVYAQHRKFFNGSGIGTLEPRQCILDDLRDEIIKWTEEGDSIILMMDANQDVRDNTIQEFLTQSGLKDAILRRHGTHKVPKTHVSGTAPIDGIFISTRLNIAEGGFSPFEMGVQGKQPDH